MPFYEKCQNCRDSIIQTYARGKITSSNYVHVTADNGVDYVTDGSIPYCRRYCTRWKKFVEDYNTCEDWMPRNNV